MTGTERRLHPASFLFSMGTHVRSLLLPGAAVIFTAGSSGRDWEVWLMVLIIPYSLAAIVRSVSFRYRFDTDEMVVRKGWIFRSERHIPYARIQNIDAVQNVFHRALGVAEVRVETASGGEPEAIMSVLPASGLAEMRRFVFEGRQRVDAKQVPETAVAEAAAVQTDELLRLSRRDLLLYGFIESRGAVVIAGAFGLLWEFGLFDRLFDLATGGRISGRGVARQLVRAAMGQGVAPLTKIALTIAAFAVLLLALRIVSMAWAYVRLYGFSLRRAGDDLRVDYGLLTRISGTIPLGRIQTLTVSESPFHQLFGRVSVHVDTAGGQGGEDQPTRQEPVAPLVRWRDLDALVAALLPDFTLTGAEWQPPHQRAIRRALVEACLVAAVACAVMVLLLRWWTIAAAVLLLGWAWIHARMYVAHLRWTLVADAIVFRTGWLWRRMTVARFSRIQVVARLESPFDRRTKMATVKVDTAGAANPANAVEIPFMAAETASSLATTLAAKAGQTAFRW
jgi:putative membrane protein